MRVSGSQVSGTTDSMVFLDNIQDGEQVHQRCVLVRGRVHHAINNSVQVSISDEAGATTFPGQRWPVCQGIFRVMLMLSPGTNVVQFKVLPSVMRTIKLTYIPLLQTPPLYLAVMVAKDSPLLIGCPPSTQVPHTSAHSSLHAALAKLRMTAYMWQALIADDLYHLGLGRRAFRLEEDWSVDTVSRHYLPLHGGDSAMHSTAKIHLVRVDKTVAELHSMSMAPLGAPAEQRHALREVFTDALKKQDIKFADCANPLVAGLILDSHYSPEQKTIFGYTAQGHHSPDGLSIGVMSAHLAHAWPRFIEEVTNCLLNTDSLGVSVNNGDGACKSMWEACAFGQNRFLHQLECAMGITPFAELLACDNPIHWAQRFLHPSAHSDARYCRVVHRVADAGKDAPRWDLSSALKLRASKHFWLPGDVPAEHVVEPWVEVTGNGSLASIDVTNKAGIAKIWVDGEEHDQFRRIPSMQSLLKRFSLPVSELKHRFDRSRPLEMRVLDMNGNSRTFDVWTLLSAGKEMLIPGTSIKLLKKSVNVGSMDHQPSQKWQWTVMLKKRSEGGVLIKATQVDIRVGAILDGAEVYYKDGGKIPCGPRWDEHGHESYMGGHQAKKLALPKSTEIVKVAVNAGDEYSSQLHGLRMWRSDGKVLGALNVRDRSRAHVTYLEPEEDHCIVGFYGHSTLWGHCAEFGIITAPKGVDLPDSAYDLPELRNTDGGPDAWPKGKRVSKRGFEDVESSDSDCISEDEDEGYDYDEGDETVGEDE